MQIVRCGEVLHGIQAIIIMASKKHQCVTIHIRCGSAGASVPQALLDSCAAATNSKTVDFAAYVLLASDDIALAAWHQKAKNRDSWLTTMGIPTDRLVSLTAAQNIAQAISQLKRSGHMTFLGTPPLSVSNEDPIPAATRRCVSLAMLAIEYVECEAT